VNDNWRVLIGPVEDIDNKVTIEKAGKSE